MVGGTQFPIESDCRILIHLISPDIAAPRATRAAQDAAIQGFLKATGLASLDEAKIQRDPKKGDFYVALTEKPGRATLEVLADMLPVVIRTFPWPKSMRWGERSAKPGALQWVRPLHAIVATFGMETEEPDVVKFAIDGKEIVVRAGEVLCIPPHMPHEAWALEDTVDLDIFDPPREDWPNKTDDYLRAGR